MEHHFATPGHVTIDVHVASGDIDLYEGPAGTTTLTIEPDSIAGDVEVEHRDRGDDHLVRIGHPRRTRLFSRGRLHVRVACPSGSDVQAQAASADLRASLPLGNVTVQTASGD